VSNRTVGAIVLLFHLRRVLRHQPSRAKILKQRQEPLQQRLNRLHGLRSLAPFPPRPQPRQQQHRRREPSPPSLQAARRLFHRLKQAAEVPGHIGLRGGVTHQAFPSLFKPNDRHLAAIAIRVKDYFQVN
jgi:hypothetical protein